LSGLNKTASFSLDSSSSTATLDYGVETAGFPVFVVSSLSNPVQIEVKYSEQFNGLNNPWSDGPYAFASGLSNTFRVETFHVTEVGQFQSFFIQGGQRWESITLLTDGKVTFKEVGFIPSIDIQKDPTFTGDFQCSSDLYNEIWKLGGNAAVAACVDAHSQPATWEVSDQGAYIRGQKPAINVLGIAIDVESLSFSTKIARGGTGWAFEQPLYGQGIQLLLTSARSESSFVNINDTLTPPNSLVLAYGFSLVTQTTLTSYYLASFAVPFEVKEDEWYSITTALNSTQYLSVTVNVTQILDVPISQYDVIPSNVAGSWRFGPYQDQAEYVKDVTVLSSNGTVVYQDPMTSTDVLGQYGVAENPAATCMDGAKRDRLVWMGDFYHTSKIIPASTGRSDLAESTLEYLAAWQISNGQLANAAALGFDPKYKDVLSGGLYSDPDYQILGLLSLVDLFQATGNTDFASRIWPSIEKLLDWMLSQVDDSTHLANIDGFIGPALGSATSASFVQALNGAADIADILGHNANGTVYRNAASQVATAVNELLWNSTLGVYTLSTSSMSDFSVAGMAFAITSGIANSSRASSTLSQLTQLQLTPGYRDSSQADPATANLSPNTNGFLLSALMMAGRYDAAKYLLDNLWGAMVSNANYTSRASWEYLAQDLSPGLGLFTSLSHPWGGAPTYILPQWIAGIRAVTPGYKTWVVEPAYDGFDLTWASAKVSTKNYGDISVKWMLNETTLTVTINAPSNTSGSFQLPGRASLGSYTLNGAQKRTDSESVSLPGGQSVITISIA
jgi:hypothetical protein